MNERIQELMGNTLDEKFAGTWSTMDMQDLAKFSEKFAELIVRECAEFANEHNEEIEGVTLGVGQALKKHFGVKE